MARPQPGDKLAVPTRSETSVAVVVILVFALAVVFLGNSYLLYNINHFKLALAMFFGIVMLMLLPFFHAPDHRVHRNVSNGRSLALILTLPLLATIPGQLISGGLYNYFVELEWATWLVSASWLLLIVLTITSQQRLVALVCGLGVIVILVSLQAIYAYFATVDAFTLDALNRESGTFGNPNYLAGFLVLHIPLFAVCLVPGMKDGEANSWAMLQKVIFVLAVTLGSVALLLTQSRVALAVLPIVLLLLLVAALINPSLFGIPRKYLMLLLFLGISGVAIALAVLPVVEYSTARLQFGSTLASRLVPWQAAWLSILDAPLLGWGSGSSYSLFFEYVDPASRLDWFQRRYPHPHNEYLEILQEGGVLGLLAYVLFIAYFLWRLGNVFRAGAANSQLQLLAIGLLVSFFAYHLLGLMSVSPRMISVRISLFIFLGIALVVSNLAGNHQPDQDSNSILSSGTSLRLFAIGLLLCAGSFYFPVAASRFGYVRALEQTDVAERFELLQQLRDSNPNIYALETLAQLELASGQPAEAERTLEELDSLILNYDGVGYLKASARLLQNDVETARALAEQYQSRDLYHRETAGLLSTIALFQRDAGLLGDQIRRMMLLSMVEDNALSTTKEEQLRFSSDQDSGIAISRIEGSEVPTIDIDFGKITLDRLLVAAREQLLSGGQQAARNRYLALIESMTNSISFAGLSPEEQARIRTQLFDVMSAIPDTAI